MFSRLLLTLLMGWILVLLLLCDGCIAKRNWDYEPLSIESTSSDKSKLNLEARVERMGRGEFGITGTLKFNYDVDETTIIEAAGYRSSSGSEEDYKPLPWSIPKQTYKEFTETHYKDMLYKNFEQCSNLPHPDKTYPWPKDDYKFTKCVATNGDGFPEIVPDGYYKMVFKVIGEVEWGFTVITKVTTNNDLIG